MKFLTRLLVSKEFVFRYFAVIFFISAFTHPDSILVCLIISGLVIGIYYGLYNDIIWRPKGTLSESFPYRAHQLWIHIISGFVGSICIYLLLKELGIEQGNLSITDFGFQHLVLFVIALMSYVGLLPRILWYFSYAQNDLFNKSGK